MQYLETLREWILRIWGTFRHAPSDRELERELEFHLEMVEHDLRREGHSPSEAARLARLRVGRPSNVLDGLRDQRGFSWLGRFSLDVVLGMRMLRKSWGMTLVGGLAIAIVIAIAAGLSSFFQVFTGGTVPLVEGDRVVAIQSFDPVSRQPVGTELADYERWRDTLESVETMGAFRTVRRELTIGEGGLPTSPSEGAAELVSVAEMTASGFRLARVAPLVGRFFVEQDEAPGEQPVVVIGEAVWRSRFGADPQVLGRSVGLDGTLHTVVGVMPEDFGFPINHRYWVPLPADLPGEAWSQEPEILVFGRLAAGFTLEGAEAELSAKGLLPGAASEERQEPLRARIVPYARAFAHIPPGEAAGILLLVTLLLVPPCANIAILVYARTVTRQAEFAARFALGASRGRIVGQIFIETLVLAMLAALCALAIANVVLSRIEVNIAQSPGASPFWMQPSISIETIVYVACLVVLAALIAGAAPALRATRGLMNEGLRALSNRISVRLGATWTALVVMQVALAVAILPTAAEMTWGYLRSGMLEPGFPVVEFSTARIALGDPREQNAAEGGEGGYAELQRELVRRLRQEGVSAVTFSSAIAGAEPAAEIGTDDTSADGARRLVHHDVGVNRIDAAFLDTFGARILIGRAFRADDMRAGSDAVIVNQAFVREVFGEVSPALGRRVRYMEQPTQLERWYEIVGVSTDVPGNDERPRMYHPLEPGHLDPVVMTLRMPFVRAGMAEWLREVATRVDSRLRIDEYAALERTYSELRAQDIGAATALIIVTTSVLLLSAAGMYALMSFTVSQRRREIGIRAALGAQPGRILVGVFRRALGQILLGAIAGLLFAIVVTRYFPIEQLGGRAIPGIVPAAAALMVLVGCLAAIGPARRAMRAKPTAALREDG